MRTYREYLEEKENGQLEEFILTAIGEYQSSNEYKWAVDGVNYSTGKNTEIVRYEKIIYDVKGQARVDTFTPNHKIPSNFFGLFVRQRTAYVLGNGIQFEQESTKEKLGENFDHETFFAGQDTLAQGVVYGFWNKDHIVYYKAREICPIFDDETGELKVAIRFWRLQDGSPMRVTLFEEDGITEYRTQRKDEKSYETLIEIAAKKPYIVNYNINEADGIEYGTGENYTALPIIPWYANRQKASYLVGLKEKIDAYDLLTSGLVNDADGEFVYWTLKNQGGMNDDVTLQQFIEKMHILKAAVIDETDEAVPHNIDPPTNARMVTKESLRADLYRDAMALDTEILKAGNVTATQINAAYEPLNEAADEFEFCTIQYLVKLLNIIGITDYPKFTRSVERNKAEETQMILQAASVLDNETIVDLLPFLTPEQKEQVKEKTSAEELSLANMGMNNE